MTDVEDNPYRAPGSVPPTGESLLRFDLALVVAVIAAVSIGFAFGKGAGMLVAMIALPVLVRSMLVFRERARRNLATTASDKTRMVLASAAVAVGIYALLSSLVAGAAIVSLVIGILTICTGGASGGTLAMGYGLGMIVAIGVGLWLSGRWIVIRWRQDTRD